MPPTCSGPSAPSIPYVGSCVQRPRCQRSLWSCCVTMLAQKQGRDAVVELESQLRVVSECIESADAEMEYVDSSVAAVVDAGASTAR